MLWGESWWRCEKKLLCHSVSKENRQKDVHQQDKRQCHKSKYGESHDSNHQKNPPHLIAFPSYRLHFEREKPQITDHHEGKDERDAEAGPIAQGSVGEMAYLAECQRQRRNENGHSRRRDATERGLLCVVDIELGESDSREYWQQKGHERQ